MAKQISINSIRPIWQIIDDAFLMKTGVYSYYFELTLNPIFSLGKEDYEKATLLFNNIFNLFPDYTVVHKIDLYTQKNSIKKKILNLIY